MLLIKLTIDLNAAAEQLAQDDDVRIVAIEGGARAFCSGIDLKEFSFPKSEYMLWKI